MVLLNSGTVEYSKSVSGEKSRLVEILKPQKAKLHRLSDMIFASNQHHSRRVAGPACGEENLISKLEHAYKRLLATPAAVTTCSARSATLNASSSLYFLSRKHLSIRKDIRRLSNIRIGAGITICADV
uniref:Uncharacterized protein n=1 Tax=Trichogramma kaykai TaxID=54128 RepID=A0ABD2XAM4_9HYME